MPLYSSRINRLHHVQIVWIWRRRCWWWHALENVSCSICLYIKQRWSRYILKLHSVFVHDMKDERVEGWGATISFLFHWLHSRHGGNCRQIHDLWCVSVQKYIFRVEKIANQRHSNIESDVISKRRAMRCFTLWTLNRWNVVRAFVTLTSTLRYFIALKIALFRSN